MKQGASNGKLVLSTVCFTENCTISCTKINTMQVLSLSDFRQNLREKLDAVANDDDVVVVNRPNNKNVVVISLQEYNGWQETMHLLSSERNRQRLAAALARVEAGQRQTHPLSDDE
jgi:antitoxin YefM